MSFDPRIVRVGIETDGEIVYYEDLNIRASGLKFTNDNQDECTVEISNLNAITRNFLLTATSPFNDNRTPKRLILEAGRESYGTVRVYEGDIVQAFPSQPPDIRLTIKALTGNFQKGNIISRSGGSRISLRSLASLIARDIGASLDFQATNKTISNYTYTGSAIKQINKLARIGGIDAYLDGNVLKVKNRGRPLNNTVRFLTKDTGLIGIPEATEHGIKATFLFDNQTSIGSAVEVESLLNESLNGTYAIFKLGFELTTRDIPFYWVAEAERY